MNDLQMPSDVKKALSATQPDTSTTEPIEPPSAKLVVRLFLIPLVIVALAVGVMFLIGLLAGGQPSMEQALARLRGAGGERTATYLVGPGSKQRYLDAKVIIDKMKQGMAAPQRIELATTLIDILDRNTRPDEGDVQHVLLLALGRTWQIDPTQGRLDSAAATESRQKVVQTLLKYADSKELPTRKAAALATVYLAGYDESAALAPKLIEKLSDEKEDIDVRIAAATVLGPLSDPSDARVIDSLRRAMSDSDPRHAELVWSSALSLAQLNQPEVADTILKLLDRQELANLQYYDREKDSRNPTFRKLSEEEQQRILINTMIGAARLEHPDVQKKLRELTESDPSPRVRAAGMEIVGRDKGTR
jgi:HEAT repeats